MMKVESIFVDGVQVGEGRRPLSEDKVTALAASMREIGLQYPITVWGEDDDTCLLVTGLHRLAAAKKLHWELIPAYFVAMDEIERGLWEIDENLMRANLTPTDEAEALARRKELWEARQKVEAESSGTSCSAAGGGAPGENKGFAQETAEQSGRSKQDINRAVSRAAIPADVRDMVRGTTLDKGIYLDEIKKIEPDEMREKVASDLEKHRSATEAAIGFAANEDFYWAEALAAAKSNNNAPPNINKLARQLGLEIHNYFEQEKKLDQQLNALLAFVDDITDAEQRDLVDGLREMASKATYYAERFSSAGNKPNIVSEKTVDRRIN